ncbi:MAG TPA: c-type cytochrome [Burkholderiaceae bacterium]|nr:c-type cytochrome [Burkholderiaceae bacterium]
MRALVLRISLLMVCLAVTVQAKAQVNTEPSELQVQVWAAACMACHGTNGKAEGAGRPLAGQPADTLIKILNFAKSGLYTGLVMPQIAKGYSDDELKRIATYFSQIK